MRCLKKKQKKKFKSHDDVGEVVQTKDYDVKLTATVGMHTKQVIFQIYIKCIHFIILK